MLLRVSYIEYEIWIYSSCEIYFSVIATKMLIVVAGFLEVSCEEVKYITHQQLHLTNAFGHV
jgi:hypothetical protein